MEGDRLVWYLNIGSFKKTTNADKISVGKKVWERWWKVWVSRMVAWA